MRVMADRIKCSHILVKKQSEAIAIIERLKKGESFANLARELSIDKGSGKRGGDLGVFGRGMMVKPFEEAVYDIITYCIQNPNASDFESKKHRVQEIGMELYADGGVDAMENIFYPIEFRIKEEIG